MLGERHFDSPLRLAPHEHVVQQTFRVDALGVKHRIAAAADERSEAAGVELPELRFLDRRLAQQLRLLVRARHLEEREPRQAHGDHHGEAKQRREQARGREAAALQRRHLAVVVEPPEREHDGAAKGRPARSPTGS